jgi:uncharacterized OB-fold protein
VTLLNPHQIGIPVPCPGDVSRPFWEACRRGELLFQRCSNGHPVFNPAPICRQCLSADLTWVQSEGVGTIYTWSMVWRPPAPEFATPYAVAIVELDEGYHMIGNIIGCDHEAVRVGLRVKVEFHPISDTISLAYFAPLAVHSRN